MKNKETSQAKKIHRTPWKIWKTMGKKKRRLAAVIAGLFVLVLAAGYTVFIAPLLEQDKWVYKEATVERGNLTVGVTESGSLEFGIHSILYDLDLEVGADDDDDDDEDDEEETVQKYLKVEEVYAAPGQRIQEGEALLKFTQDSVSSVRRLLESALADAQVAYNEAESEYNLSVLEAKTNYETSKVNQNYASEIYQAADDGVDNEISSMQTEVEQRQANVASLEEKLADAQESYSEALSAYEDAQETMSVTGTDHASNFMTVQTEYLNAQTRFRNAETALEQAQKNITDNEKEIAQLKEKIAAAQARRGIDKLDVRENYQESVINGDNAQITYEARVESLKEDLEEAQEDKKSIEEQLAAFEAFVGEEGILYADGEGIVTEVGYSAGDTLVQSGTAVAYAAPENMTISVDVTQEDVVELEVGDQVEIQFGAYEDTPYQGTILSIDTTATSQESATISYKVVIGVQGDTGALYGGMTADVTFVTEEKENVLFVSRKAIVEENGRTYVYAKTALGGRELKEVQTGIRNGSDIEILSGLEEGDTIYIASRISSEAEVEETQQGGSQGAGASDGAVSFDGADGGFQFNGGGMEGITIDGAGGMPGSREAGGPGTRAGGTGGNSAGAAGMEVRP